MSWPRRWRGAKASSLYPSYRLVVFLTLLGSAGFIAATVVGIVFGVWALILIGLALSALNIARLVYLLRMGKKGWNEKTGPADDKRARSGPG